MDQPVDTNKLTNDIKQLLNLSLVSPQHNERASNDNVGAKAHSSNASNPRKDSEPEIVGNRTKASDAGSKQNFKKTKSDSAPLNTDKSRKQKHKSHKQTEKSGSKSSQEVRKGKEKEKSSVVTPANNSVTGKDNRVPRILSNMNHGNTDNSRSQHVHGHSRANQSCSNNVKSENSPHPAKNSWDDLSREVQIKLDQNKIYFLKKKNMRFPNAKYFCRLCEFHMDTLEICDKHLNDAKHTHRKEVNDMDSVLINIPPPMSNHLDAVTAAIEHLYEQHGLKPTDRDIRRNIVQRLERNIREVFPDVLLHMYGTSLTQMGLKTADINITLSSTDKDRKLTALLKDTYNLMKDKTDAGFTNVHSDFSATIPALLMTDSETGYKLTITIYCYSSLCTSELLSIYSDFDDRVVKLAVAFRYWAQLCGVDKHQVGFLPPIALNIMVVFFLQSLKKQVVPIFNPPVICGEDTGDFSKDKPYFDSKRNRVMKTKAEIKNVSSVGELWVELLAFYCIELDVANVVICIRDCRPISRTQKPWNTRKLAVEDPYMLKKNLTRMVSHSYDFWQCAIRKAYHYFGLPRGPDGKSHLPNYDFPENISGDSQSPSEESKEQKCMSGSNNENKSEIETPSLEKADVAVDSTNTKDDDLCDGICSSTPHLDCSRDTDNSSVSKNLKSDNLNIRPNSPQDSSQKENSLSPNSNIGVDSTPSNPSPSGDEIASKDDVQLNNSSLHAFVLDYVNGLVQRAVDLVDSDKSVSSATPDRDSVPTHYIQENSTDKEPTNDISKPTDDSTVEKKANTGTEKYSFIHQMASKTCSFEFSKEFLSNKKEPMLICSSCDKEGHHKNECPLDELPEILPISGFTEFHHKILEEALQKMPQEVGLSDQSIQLRHIFLEGLEAFIQVGFPGAKLQLFGSSCNGFGFDRSDMDICLNFIKRRPGLDKVVLIERLANLLKIHKSLKNVQSIPTAKVPIVKFTIKENDLDADISLYNTLAQENTHLLLCYSKIDPRVRVLGYTIKTFAQVCDIGDASRGSLSSYAYVLMMLYYLQQVEPPVIPVLQELHSGQQKPEMMIEGCNAWFMSDLRKLPELWPDMGKNKMSAAELWLGFLRFYVEEFNYKEFVISIRQKEPLTRFEKLWNGFCLAIEDPFDLKHNLGSGLSSTMNSFILKTYINGRMLYGSPIDDNMELFNKYQSSTDYFFDTELLSEARPPNSRGCRHCGKIGHMIRHCPLQRQEKEEEQQKQRQQQQKQYEDQQRKQMQQLQQQARKDQPRQQQKHENVKNEQQLHQVPQNPLLLRQEVRKEQEDQGQHAQKQQKKQPIQQPELSQKGQGPHAEQQPHPQQMPPAPQDKGHQQQLQNKSQQQQSQQQQSQRHQQQSQRHLQQSQQHSQQQPQQSQQQQQSQRPQQQSQRQQQQSQRQQQPQQSQRQQQQYASRKQSFQQQQQLEAVRLSKRLERDLFGPNGNRGRNDNSPQNRHMPGPNHNFNPQFNMGNPQPLMSTPPMFMNQMHPMQDVRMGQRPPFPPSLVPPAQRPRGIINNPFPFGYNGPPPGLPQAPPQQAGPFYFNNYNFNFNNNDMNNSNDNNNGRDADPSHLPAMAHQHYSNMPSTESPPGFHSHPTSSSDTQEMSPVVQNLFASAQGKVLDARSSHPHWQNKD